MSEECEGSGGYGCGVSAFHCECESKCRIQRPTKEGRTYNDKSSNGDRIGTRTLAVWCCLEATIHLIAMLRGTAPFSIADLTWPFAWMPATLRAARKRPFSRMLRGRGRLLLIVRAFLLCTSLKRYGTCISKATTYIWYVTSSVFGLGFHGKRN